MQQVVKVKHLIVLLIAGIFLLTVGILAHAQEDSFVDSTLSFDPFGVTLGGMQEDPLDPFTYSVDMDDYPSYQFVLENTGFILYLDQTTHNIAIYVKESGYAWFSTDPNYTGRDALTNRNHNQQTQNRVRSSIYYRTTQIDTVSQDRYLLNENHSIQYEMLQDGFRMKVHLTQANIQFDVVVVLNEVGFSYAIPFDSIQEGEVRLHSVRVFPYFGATNGKDKQGYMFIPDGSGALIRFQDQIRGNSYTQTMYGSDLGYLTSLTPNAAFSHIVEALPARMPVFGMVHGINQNAYLAVVESGKEYGQIRMETGNSVTKYFFNSMSFMYRNLYFKPTNKTGSGFRISSVEPAPFDVKVNIHLLSGEEANYVGMAKAYRNTLDMKRDFEAPDAMPIHFDFVTQDVKSGLLSKVAIPMTNYAEIKDILSDLEQVGLANFRVSVHQKSTQGESETNPIASLGGARQFDLLQSWLSSRHGRLFVVSDLNYTWNYSGSVAKQLGGVILRFDSNSQVFPYHYALDNLIWQSRFDQILNVLNRYDVGIDFDKTATLIYTHLNSQRTTIYRNQMATLIAEYLDELLKQDIDIALRDGNDYALPYATQVNQVPLSSSGYSFITDTVPFYSIVFSNQFESFSTALNFVSNRQTYLLRMMEYGVYPAYVLTREDTYQLRGSDNLSVYTSEYARWKPMILAEVAFLRQVLDQTLGAEIIGHRYLGQDVYEVLYSNQKKVVVNYSRFPRVLSPEVTLEAQSAIVLEVVS